MTKVLAIAVILVGLLAGCSSPSIVGCTALDTCKEDAATNVSSQSVPVKIARERTETLLEGAGFIRETTVNQYPATWRKGDDSAQITQNLTGSFVTVTLPEGTLQCDLEAASADAPSQIEQIKQMGYTAAQGHTSWKCQPVQ